MLMSTAVYAQESGKERIVIEPYSLIKLELENVWASEGGGQEAFLLTDAENFKFGPGSYVYTDEAGEGWIQLVGSDNRRCGWFYVFMLTRLTHAPCPKSDLKQGSATCVGYGTTVINNKCEGEIFIETPSATVKPVGTYFAVTYLPDEEVSVVQMYEGEALVFPVLDAETRVLGEPQTLPEGFFWFSAPENSQGPVRGLDARELHPLDALPVIVEEFSLDDWQERVVKRAQADRQDVPDIVAAAANVEPVDRAPYLSRPDVSPKTPGPLDAVVIEVSARDSDLERIEIRVPGEPAIECLSSPCTANVGPFAEGDVSYQVSAFDRAGNSKTRQGSFRVREPVSNAGTDGGVAPEIIRLDLSPAQPVEGEQASLVVEATDEDIDLDRLEIYANGTLLEARPCGDYQCVAEFVLENVARETLLELRAFDQAGNETVRSRRLETSPPVTLTELELSVSVSPPEPTSEDTVTVSAALSGASEGVGRIDIFVNDELLATCAVATCQGVVEPSQPADPVIYRVEAADRAGRSVSKDGTLTREAPTVAKADLNIESLRLVDEVTYNDESEDFEVSVTIVVRNQGDVAAGPFQVALRFVPAEADDATISAVVSSDPVAAGAAVTLRTDLVYAYNQDATDGVLFAWADACPSGEGRELSGDSACRVDESDETNNVLAKEGVILPGFGEDDLSDTLPPEVRSAERYDCDRAGDSLCTKVTFSEPMARETVTVSASFVDDGEEVPVEVSDPEWLDEGETVIFTLPHYSCSTYVMTLQGSDLAGNELGGDTRAELTTRGCAD